MIITSGNTTIDTAAVKHLSKDELYDILKGRISEDFNELWVKICKANGNNESPIKLSKSSKKS